MTAISHKWKPIEDLTDPASLTDGELGPLLEVWKEQRTALPNNGEDSEFSKRLAREWAIETGIIERAYTLDRGTTETLIKEGIKASLIRREATNRDPEELAAILQDHLDALDGLFAFVKGDRELSTSYIKEMHSALLRHVKTHTVRDASGNFFEKELVKGEYKVQSNTPTRPDGSVHEYCPPEQTASEMDRLIELYHEHSKQEIPAEIEAAWLHHAFTQIHPFADGNGRVARMLASLVFIKSGGFPLLIRREENVQYIDDLEQADGGNLEPLVRLFVRGQRRAALGALQVMPHDTPTRITPPRSPEDVVAEIRDLLTGRNLQQLSPAEAFGGLVKTLLNQAEARLTQLAHALQNEVEKSGVTAEFGVYSAANTDRVLKLHVRQTSSIVVSLSLVGATYRGVVVGSISFAGSQGTSIPTIDDMFQTNYKDEPDEAEERFLTWLEQGLTRALTLWREQL